jgi:transposase
MPRLCERLAQPNKSSNSFPASTGQDSCRRAVKIVDIDHIDKGIPTSGLLAQVLVAKYSDHLPLYRQETILGRSGYAIPRLSLAQWVGVCGV